MSLEIDTKAVADFAPQGSGPEIVLQYPFARPTTSFLTDGETVMPIKDDGHAIFIEEANRHLLGAGLPPLRDRVPIVGYGSNINPHRLASKMRAYKTENNRQLLQTIPSERVVIEGSIIAWHGRPGQNGSAFAELYKGPETDGRQTEAFLQYLTVEQLALMHATEGVTYHLAQLQVVSHDGVPIEAYAYVAGNSQVLLKDGRPVEVAFGETPADGTMTARQAVDYMLEGGTGERAGYGTAEELVAANALAKLAEKKARQDLIQEELAKAHKTKPFSYLVRGYIGRADFGSVKTPGHTPQLLHLAEEHLAALRPSAAKIEAKALQLMKTAGLNRGAALAQARKLDIMTAIRARATAEIGDRLKHEHDIAK